MGKPNVGKSSLLNQIVGQDIAIVTYRPQTTRTKITGIVTQDDTQLVFIDTPGLLKPKTTLQQNMVRTVNEAVGDVDAAVLVVEPTGEPTKAEQELIRRFKQSNMPAVLVINKIDLLPNKQSLMQRMQMFMQLYNFSAIVPLSAKTGNGVSLLLKELQRFAVESVHFFPDDAITDQPEKVLAAEMLRKHILLQMNEEIPHGIAVTVEKWQEKKRRLYIEMLILCNRENHKGMIIGKNGQRLKEIATKAREDMQRFFDLPVDLRCWVKVKENWQNNANLIRSYGLE